MLVGTKYQSVLYVMKFMTNFLKTEILITVQLSLRLTKYHAMKPYM
jgi:hypothetical protein